jgi:hypothetical protein
MSDESPNPKKRNWPLIWISAVVALLVGTAVIGLVAMYIAHFNLLEWLE